jgi:hypothetical protein
MDHERRTFPMLGLLGSMATYMCIGRAKNLMQATRIHIKSHASADRRRALAAARNDPPSQVLMSFIQRYLKLADQGLFANNLSLSGQYEASSHLLLPEFERHL